MTGIGERINARRKELGMTQEELSKKLGYKNKSTISQIENGVNDIMQATYRTVELEKGVKKA